MKNQDQIIREEMRRLISKSCSDLDNIGAHYNTFHKALLKFFFGVVDVSVDYEKEFIFLWNSKPKSAQSMRLYHINEAVSTKISYTNLEETLKGCLEDGDYQTRFYKSLLFHYNGVNKDIDQSAISA